MFMRYTYMLEFVGTIALIFTIFSSVGFSSWTYGSNLIQNGDFSEFSALPADWYQNDWSDCSLVGDTTAWGNNMEYNGGQSINVVFNQTDVELMSNPILVEKNKTYFISLDYKNMTYVNLSDGLGGAIYITSNDSSCTSIMGGYDGNLLWDTETFNSGAFLDSSVVSLGAGWYRATATMQMSSLPDDSDYILLIFGWKNQDEKYTLDNVIFEENGTDTNLVLNGNFSAMRDLPTPKGWYATDYSDADCRGTTNNVQWNHSLFQYDSFNHYLNITFLFEGWTQDMLTSPFYLDPANQYLISIDFKPLSDAYGINDANFSWLGTFRSDAEVCSAEGWGLFRWWNTTHAFYTTDVQVFVDAQITSLGGGWYRYQEVFTPSQPDGANMVMTINGDRTFVKYGIDNVKIMELTYQCEGWECNTTARSVVGLSPLVIGVGILAGMIAMFMMRNEDESMIALVLKGGVIALISVVMLAILVSVIA